MSEAKKPLHRVICLMCAFLLTVGLFPASAFADNEASRVWSDDIPHLLAAGEYEEGVVLACVDTSQTSSASAALSRAFGGATATDGETVTNVEKAAVADSLSELDTSLPASSSGYEVVTVRDESKTTEQLLNDLAADPAVLFAEPNYVVQNIEQDTASEKAFAEALAQAQAEGSLEEESKAAGLDAQSAADTRWSTVTLAQGELTNLQYGFNTDTTKTPSVGYTGNAVSTNDTSWNTAGGNMKRPVVVAVLDTGIDYNHPDLANVMYTFKEDQQAQLNCGEFGFNGVNGEDPTNVSGYGDHGTHCAGVIGAEWNSWGVSGAASKVSIVNVRVISSDNESSITNIANSFAFVKRAVQSGVPIEITSNSYGLKQQSRILNALVYDLGETCNVTSVFASGNDSYNLDNQSSLPNTLADNPYAVIVAASNANGQLATYSNYSSSLVDVAAPGTGILSTYPLNNLSYIPDADTSESAYHQNFDDENKAIRFKELTKKESGDSSTSSGTVDTISSEAYLNSGSSSKITLSNSWASFQSINFFGIESEAVNISDKKPQEGEQAYLGFSMHVSLDAPAVQMFSLDGSFTQDKCIQVKTTDETNPWATTTLINKDPSVGKDGSWSSFSVALPENTDYENFQFRVGLAGMNAQEITVYLDSLGVGTALSPFAYSSGTSMACPAAAGSLAVLAAEHEYNYDAAQRATDLKSTVRAESAFEGKVATGGVIDMSVAAGGTSTDEHSPVINEASIEGNTLTLAGEHFGTGATVECIQMSLESDTASSNVPLVITSQSDTLIAVTFSQAPTGVLNVKVVASNGKSFTVSLYAGKSDSVYKDDLTMIEEGDVSSLDSYASHEADGVMIGLQGNLYYLPQQARSEEMPATQRMWRYNIASDSWAEMPALPEPLENVSIVLHKGMLLVEGGTMKMEGDAPVKTSDSAEAIYAFNPSAQSWSKVSAEGVPLNASLVGGEGAVYVVGASNAAQTATSDESAAAAEVQKRILSYDPASGAGEVVAHTEGAYANPRAVMSDNSMFVASIGASGSTLERVIFGSPSAFAMLPSLVSNTGYAFGLAQTAAGAALVGPAFEGGTDGVTVAGSDMAPGSRYKDGSVFASIPKRAADGKIIGMAACTYNGKLYVLGATAVEQPLRFFRATDIETAKDPFDVPVGGGSSSGDAGGAVEKSPSAKTGDASIAAALVLAGLAVVSGSTLVAARARRRRS